MRGRGDTKPSFQARINYRNGIVASRDVSPAGFVVSGQTTLDIVHQFNSLQD